jgi:hypothetical protein
MPLPRAIDRAPNNINLAPESSENPKMRIAGRAVDRKKANPGRFCKFPVKFPVSRELRPAKSTEKSEIFGASVFNWSFTRRDERLATA